jgi:hypothetical protein
MAARYSRTFFCASFIQRSPIMHHKRLMMRAKIKQKFKVRFGETPKPARQARAPPQFSVVTTS